LTLAGGRVVGWATYGDPDGRPVVCVHGSPDSRVIWQLFDDVARTHGLRLVAIDRPGFGISDPQPGRRVLDWPGDAAAVADVLGLERFPVVAISGGALFGAATAWSMPDCVTGLGLFSVIGPLDHPGATDGTNRPVRATYWMAAHAPWAIRPFAAALARGARRNPERAARQIERTRPPEDRLVLARPDVRGVLLQNLPNQFRDPATVVHEFRLAVQPWPFPLAELRVPTHIWQGGRDDVHTPAMARHLAAHIPGAELTFEPEYSTFTFVDHLDPIAVQLAAWAR
jgi:pimeloyl-ACP methyl ester carboxylesterase